MRENGQDDARSVSSDLGSGVTGEQYEPAPVQCTDRPRTRGTEGDLRYRATTKAVSRYQHVVVNRERKQRETGKEVANNRPGDLEWRATYPATRRLSDRAPFATALSGLDPDRVADEDYPWCVP